MFAATQSRRDRAETVGVQGQGLQGRFSERERKVDRALLLGECQDLLRTGRRDVLAFLHDPEFWWQSIHLNRGISRIVKRRGRM